MGLSNHHCPLPFSSKIPQIPCQEVFGPAKGLLRRCLGVQTPTHKVFGRLGLIIPIIFGRIFAQNPLRWLGHVSPAVFEVQVSHVSWRSCRRFCFGQIFWSRVVFFLQWVHPRKNKLTWIPKMMVWKMLTPFKYGHFWYLC